MKTFFNTAFALLFVIISIGCKNNNQPKTSNSIQSVVTQLTPSEFKSKSANQTIIDIRTPQEFRQGHLEGAVNINYFQRGFIDSISKYDKTKPLFIYCRSGNRTSSASHQISKIGFGEIYDLKGGYLNWIKNNN